MVTAQLHRAITEAWDGSELDWLFKQRWAESDRASFSSLNDGEAAPGTPFPYCVMVQGGGTVINRMSGHSALERHYIQDVPWTFDVYAASNETESAKNVARTLAEQVLRVFGGHPDPASSHRVLLFDTGRHVLTQYQRDYGMREAEDVHRWAVEYIFRIDMPVAK